MALLSDICRKILLKSNMYRYGRISYRYISTTGKNADSKAPCDPPQAIYKKDFTKPFENGNWMSFGFNSEDRGEDRFQFHALYFVLFTVTTCFFGFLYHYLPEKSRKDWVRREAFIRLHEREQLGLEPVDPNYIDPAKIVLPPDEELKEEDIVI